MSEVFRRPGRRPSKPDGKVSIAKHDTIKPELKKNMPMKRRRKNDREEKVEFEREDPLTDEKKINFTKLNTQSTSCVKYTPLEQQFMDIKRKHPHVILLIECGYKYRCFDKDSEIASRELNLGSFPDRNFVSSSFPIHRLPIHMRRLVAKGYKVGVVKQVETAALKAAGDNRSRIFERKLAAIYTKSTLVEDDTPICHMDKEICTDVVKDSTGYLICIYEIPTKSAGQMDIGVMAVRPTTGDISYWCFVDNCQRVKLESILSQLQPVEILVPQLSLTLETEQLLKSVIDSYCTLDDRICLERMDDNKFQFTQALKKLSDFYNSLATADGSRENSFKTQVLSLPPVIICCFAALLDYLQELKLEEILKNPSQIQEMYGSPGVMFLSASTIRNLELFYSSSTGTFSDRGSLMWILDRTSTRFGSRLLRQWIAQPLTDACKIQSRLSIVMEIMNADIIVFSTLRNSLKNLPDLDRMLCATLHLRVNCQDFYLLVHHLHSVYEVLQLLRAEIETSVRSCDLKMLLNEINSILQSVTHYLTNLNEAAFRAGDKTSLFNEDGQSSAMKECRQEIADVLLRLDALKPNICAVLKLQSFDFTSIGGHEYVIEVKNDLCHLVPSDWIKMSGTKQASRFRSPEVEDLLNTLSQLREKLQHRSYDCWMEYLRVFNQSFYKYKRATHLLSTLDCYFSLADFAQQEGYCRPEIKENEKVLHIQQGRHPVLERFMHGERQYVANDTHLSDKKCCSIITGPNMGGKSSYIRQVALTVLLAQIGSYVPAKSATLSVADGIHVRMGAADDICRKRSTFLVEMQEMSEILRSASLNSLVILDELGRGTSTYDGMAIAYATLEHLIMQVECRTLFVTHYLPLTRLHHEHAEKVCRQHMSFLLDEESNSPAQETLTFLYQLKDGVAERSYGMNVARLAGIPESIVNRAVEKAHVTEDSARKRRKNHHKFLSLFQGNDMHVHNSLVDLRNEINL